jgi:hypothetical protein
MNNKKKIPTDSILIYQIHFVREELFLDNPLHVILNNSKLAYTIYVILIANKELIKKISNQKSIGK